jgi:hypothetical protein
MESEAGRALVDSVNLLTPGDRHTSLCASTMASAARAASPMSWEFFISYSSQHAGERSPWPKLLNSTRG